MLRQLPKRALYDSEEEELTGGGSSSVGGFIGGLSSGASAVSGLMPPADVSRIAGQMAGGTVAALAHGAVGVGRAAYNAVQTAREITNIIAGNTEAGESPLPVSSPEPEPKAKAKANAKAKLTRVKATEIVEPGSSTSPEASHEARGSRGRPRSESRRRLEARPDEDKPEEEQAINRVEQINSKSYI